MDSTLILCREGWVVLGGAVELRYKQLFATKMLTEHGG